MQTMISTERTPEVREAVRIIGGFSREDQRDLVNFLRGVAFGGMAFGRTNTTASGTEGQSQRPAAGA